MNTLVTTRARAVRALRKVDWVPPLVARLILGSIFIPSGWGKIHHLAKVVGFFVSLGIPAAAFNAHLVAWTELVCGDLILIGLLTRVATIPLIVTMVVATVTAKQGDIHGLTSLLGLAEVTNIALLVYLLVDGPGFLALDTAIRRTLRERRARTPRERRIARTEARSH